MADFSIAYAKTEFNEGSRVYAILEGDRGGETYGGLTRKDNPKFAGWPAIDAEKKKYPNGRIPNGTRIPAAEPYLKEYYRVNYWVSRAKGDSIQNQTIANFVFDTVVNHGKGPAVIMNGVINSGASIPDSNSITTAALKAMNDQPARVYPYLWKARETYIRGLADFARFGKGWINRLNRYPKAIGIATGAGASAETPKKKS